MKSNYFALNCGMGLVLIFAFAVLTGCTSKGVLPAKNLSDAEMAIRVAKETNATINAPLDIRLAEEKLQKAQESVHKKDYISAQRLADEALMDAQLAQEKSRTAKIKNMEAELAKKHSEAMMLEADEARLKTEEALAQKQQIEQELAELQAKQTDRGAVITLGNILFEVNKSALLPGGFLAIDKLSEFLKKYPSRNLSIEGHTDSRGSDMYNLGLSQQRATSVFNALLQRGVSGHRMITKGLGEQYPVAGNETEAGRQQNRRVEVIILNEAVKTQ